MSQHLRAGDQAPVFTATDVKGRPVSLQAFGNQNILLVFLRYAGCPWCNLALHRLTMEYELLKKQNCNIVAIIQSTSENVEANIYKRHDKIPPFPVVADQQRQIYDLYGVGTSVAAAVRSVTKIPYWVHAVRKQGFSQTTIDGSLFLVPATFLISGRTGKILLASYGKSFYEHETFTRIYEELGFID